MAEGRSRGSDSGGQASAIGVQPSGVRRRSSALCDPATGRLSAVPRSRPTGTSGPAANGTSELVRQRESRGQREDARLGVGDRGGFIRGADGLEDGVDAGGDLVHVLGEQAAGGDGRSAEADAGGLEGGTRLERDGVLVTGDVGEIEGLLRLLRGEFGQVGAEVDEEEVVVGAAGHDPVAARLHRGAEGARVLDDLGGVGLELGLEALAETHGLGGDDVHERAALGARENRGVDHLGVGGAAEDQAAARAAQGLVRGGRDEVGMGNGRRVVTRGDEAGDVRDVGEEQGADGAGDFTHAGEVDDAGVGAGADGDHLGLLALGRGGELVVVDQAVVLTDTVLHELIELAGEIGGVAVGEVAAVTEVHAEDLVTRLEHGGVDGEVGLGARVRLHVGVLGAEELLGTVDRELLDLVDELAAAVPAFARVTLGILVGQHAALGLQDRRVGEVLRGDELNVALLAGELGGDGGVELGIELRERRGVEHVRRVGGSGGGEGSRERK